MSISTLSIPCPTCKKQVLMTDAFPYRPFCSKRCQLIDLGEWASENYRVASESVEEDEWSDDFEK